MAVNPPKYGLGTPLFVVAYKDILASSPYNFNHGQTFTSAIPDGAISSSSAPNDVAGQSLASARSSSASQGENERIYLTEMYGTASFIG